MIGGGVIFSFKFCIFNWLLDVLEVDWDLVGWFDEVNVFLWGVGIGVWGFVDLLCDLMFVDDVIVEVVLEYD